MTPLFAVDSDAEVTQALWDQVVAASINPPKVWFRYLDNLTAAEIVRLHGYGCSLGAIFRGATAAALAGTYADGVAAANGANTLASGIGLPVTMCIFLDVEASTPPSVAFLQGWADTMRAGPYWKAGGIYCAPFQPSFYTPFLAARAANANVSVIVLWSAQPVKGISTGANMPEWGPATDGTTPVVAWQYYEGRAGDAYGGVVDLDEVDDAFQGVWAPAPQAVGPAPTPTPPPSGTYTTPGGLVAQWQVAGTVSAAADKFTFPIALTDAPGNTANLEITLDTGAFELMLAGPDVTGLVLPNLGNLEIMGVTGGAQAYNSQVTCNINGQIFSNVPCVVDPSANPGGSLFGLQFFINRKLGLLLDTVAGVLVVFGPPA